MAEIANNSIFSQVDSSNTGSLPGISGSSAPSQIDDSIRALIGAVKREHDWRNYTVTSSGSANAYVLTYSVAPAAYYTGQRFSFTTNFAVTGSATVNVNTLGAKTIKKIVSGVKTNLASGDIASGDFIDLVYDGTDMVWVNKGVASVSAASDTASGIVELATTTEQLTGTDATRASTPDSISALWEQGADVASAGTVSLGEGGYFNITGTTTITDIDFATDKAGRKAWVKFAGALTLTHNASTLILPGGANITTAAGDTACFVSEGSDVVRCTVYQKASGLPVVSPASGGITSLGTITTTSGTSQTLSGLTLTNYKFLRLVFKGVSTSSTNHVLVGNSSGDAVRMTIALSNNVNTIGGILEIDLANAVSSFSGAEGTTGGAWGTSSSPFTTSSTAIYVAPNGGASFDAGSIIVYGVS